MNKYRNVVFVLIFFGMVSLLIGVTYSFFNYTRTGSANTVSVGNISFTSTQGPAINLSNIFPVDRDDIDIDTDNVGTVTINVTGSTDYDEGIEYLISVIDANNEATSSYGSIEVPFSVDISYSVNGNGNSIGTLNNNYFNEGVRGGDTSYYKILSTNTVRNKSKLLVGYIAPGETGINGNIVIKAFLDKDRIGISDTYPETDVYIVNPNMTTAQLNECISDYLNWGMDEYLEEGETIAAYCAGTGTILGNTLLEDMYMGGPDAIDYFTNLGIVLYSHQDGTSEEWVRGRTILSTEEWNSLTATGLSFKIKVEANEGIWVDDPGKIATCPNCKFVYIEADDNNSNPWYMVGNEALWDDNTNSYISATPTVLNPNDLTDNYLDIVDTLGKDYFLGVILNTSNQIERAYACGVKNGEPFCLEGTSDGSKYNSNKAILQSINLWNNGCETKIKGAGYSDSFEGTYCPSEKVYTLSAELHDHGCVIVHHNRKYNLYNALYNYCYVYDYGKLYCNHYVY